MTRPTHFTRNGASTSPSGFLQRYPLKPADYDRFPAFEYREEPFATVLMRLLPSLLGMLVLLTGALLIPFLALRRYQVATS